MFMRSHIEIKIQVKIFTAFNPSICRYISVFFDTLSRKLLKVINTVFSAFKDSLLRVIQSATSEIHSFFLCTQPSHQVP